MSSSSWRRLERTGSTDATYRWMGWNNRATAPRPHVGCHEPRHADGLEEVDVERLIPLLVCAFHQVPAHRVADVVHQDIDAPELGHALGDETRGAFGLADVGLDSRHPPACLGSQLVCRRPKVVWISGTETEVTAFFCESAGRVETDPLAPARDENDLVLKTEIHVSGSLDRRVHYKSDGRTGSRQASCGPTPCGDGTPIASAHAGRPRCRTSASKDGRVFVIVKTRWPRAGSRVG